MGLPLFRRRLSAGIFIMLISMLALITSSLHAKKKPVNGRNATVINWGADANNILFTFTKQTNGTWSQVQVNSGKTLDTLKELGRDEWTIYLNSINNGAKVGLNLWRKEFTTNGKPNKGGKIVSSAASALPLQTPMVRNTLSAALPQKQAVPTPPKDDSTAGGVDVVATGVSVAKLGTGLSKGVALGTATVTQGPLFEGQGPADLGNIDKSPNSTLKNMCSILSIASSSIKGQVDKAGKRKAQEKVMDQWVNILYDAQMQSGVSIDSVEPESLINTMVLTQNEIEKELPVSNDTQNESISTGYNVNDPGGALKPGAKEIPVIGPARFMVLNKTISFAGVSGAYKLTRSYEGKIGKIYITPGLGKVPAHNSPISTKPEWTSFDISRTTLELAGIADPSGVVAVAAAYLHPVCNSEEANRSKGDYCYKHSDTRGVGIIPIGCNPALPDHQAGLCYKTCANDYKGVGPVCWTSQKLSIPRGAGIVPSGCPASHPLFEAGLCYKSCAPGWKAAGTICYQKCPAGYRDDGLYCGKTTYGRGAGYVIWDKKKCERNPLATQGCEKKGALWYPRCKPGFQMTTVNFCQTKGCPAGFSDIGVSCKMPSQGRGVGVVRNVCAAGVPDLDGGLCYKNCPQDYNGVGPVCWTQKPVSQPRGVGLVPDQCPSSHPNFDAGLCYRNCPNPAYAGVGPVCWGSCTGRYKEQCGVGCATSKVSCGLVTTEMVIAPLEAVASILSLGGYSLVDKAKDGIKKGLKEAVDAADGPAAKAFGKTLGQQAAIAAKKSLKKLDNLSKGLAKRKNAIVKSIKDNTLEPIKDRASKAWIKGAQKRLDNKASKLAKSFEKELIQSGATPSDLDKLMFQKVAKSKVESEVAEKAAKAALKKNSPKMLARIEIKDKILRKLSQSWNNTDKAWLNVGRKCAGLGINVAGDWGDAQN